MNCFKRNFGILYKMRETNLKHCTNKGTGDCVSKNKSF